MKYAHPIIALLICVASGYAVDLSAWLGMRDGLIAFLGLISAALLQLIPVTTNFLAGDELTPDEAGKLSEALQRQQNFWVGMLAVNVLTVVTLVLSTLMQSVLIVHVERLGIINFSFVFSGLIGGLLAFVLLRLVSLLGGVLSLQRLRTSLVMAAANRRAAIKAEEIQRQLTPSPHMVPSEYGRVIQPPH
ncbi:hypothetical protein [Alcaligenes faecalis]|uniref:hypothetical protein n=1 Tax=Alcaligenes faecalis TaxID=511 RepID=UPI00122D0118|nr:hypothetical protein [Alcaligenes faecalis]KAA1283888.1 hypothetical protein D7S43_19430 [Alcaligenes faecalis]